MGMGRALALFVPHTLKDGLQTLTLRPFPSRDSLIIIAQKIYDMGLETDMFELV